MKHIYRHGDYLLSPITKIAKSAKKVTKDALNKPLSRSFVFGVGEATGHNHVAVVSDVTKAQWYRANDGGWYVTFDEEATLTHPEHSLQKDLVVPAGIYRVRQVREMDWFQLVERRVLD